MPHERVNRDAGPVEGGARLSYRHAGPAWTDPHRRTIDEIRLEDLLALTDLGPEERAALSRSRRLSVLSNGWQSWSPSWELAPGERMPGPGTMRRFSVFINRPGDRPKRGRIRSHFLIYLRAGDLMLGLASRNSGSAPVGFEFNRKAGTVRIDLHSAGKRRANGEPLAEIAVVWGRGYFEFKDRLAAAFGGLASFDRLSFLRARGSERPVPGGWESWYNHYSDINEDLVLSALDSLDDNGNFVNRYYIERGKPTVFQVDDGWEIAVGDWEANRERFPNGMKRIADRVRGKGFIPGIWIAPFAVTTISRVFHERPEWLLRDSSGRPARAGWLPAWGGWFHCLDLSREDVREHLYALFRRLVDEWGFRYLKLDFLYAGLLEGARAGGGAAYEWYEEVVGRIASMTRNAEGRPVAWLGCGAPLEASFRHFPLMRVGADTREAWDLPAARFIHYPGRPSACMSLRDVAGRALLDGSVLASDPDVFFLRSVRCKLTRTERELLALVDFMFGSQLMVSDDVQDYPSGDEESFTTRIVELYDRLSGREWGIKRIEGLAYRVFSRSGDVIGILNLGDRVFKTGERTGMDLERAIVSHATLERGVLSFQRRSISLFAV